MHALGVCGGPGGAATTVCVLARGRFTWYAGWPYIFYLNVPAGAAHFTCR